MIETIATIYVIILSFVFVASVVFDPGQDTLLGRVEFASMAAMCWPLLAIFALISFVGEWRDRRRLKR